MPSFFHRTGPESCSVASCNTSKHAQDRNSAGSHARHGLELCPEKFLPVCYGAHTGNAEEYFQGGPDSPRSLWRICTWICKSMLLPHGREILPDIQTNARLRASSEKARFVELAERSDSFRCCYGDTSCMGGGLFGPPHTMRGGPRRTRRLRLGLSVEHGPSVLQFVRRLSFGKFCRLTPSGTAGVKPSSDGGGGGRSYRMPACFANSLRLSKKLMGYVFLFRPC